MNRLRQLSLAIFAVVFLGVPTPAAADNLEWNDEHPKFRVAEGIATGALFAGTAVLRAGLEPPDQSNWDGPVLLDRPVRNLLAAESRSTAQIFGTASDVLVATMISYPFVADVGVTTAGFRRSGSTALQLGLIGLESFGATMFLTRIGKFFVARERPPHTDCGEAGGRNLFCSSERFQSFPSGHTSFAVTGASYVCALHEHVDLYGGGVPDRLACWTGIGVASATGIFRVISDNHYFSDIIAGAAIGVTTGYLLPKLLHFGFRGEKVAGERTVDRALSPAPVGIQFRGTF